MDKSVFKAPKEFAVLREMARAHSMLVRDVIRAQARLKSIYRSPAISTADAALYGPRQRQEWESRLPPAARHATSKLYAHYDWLLELKKQAESELIAESKRYPVARIPQTAPGLRS